VTASPAPSDVTRAAALCPQFRRKRQQIEAMRARTASLTTRAAGDDAGPRGSDDAGGGNADGDEAEEGERLRLSAVASAAALAWLPWSVVDSP
jgi:hypothetical protein